MLSHWKSETEEDPEAALKVGTALSAANAGYMFLAPGKVAEMYGIAKIKPPAGWAPRSRLNLSESWRFLSKQQRLDTMQNSVPFTDGSIHSAASRSHNFPALRSPAVRPSPANEI